MKLFAGRAVDTDDLRQLWPHTSFDTVAEAVIAFEAAYPTRTPTRTSPNGSTASLVTERHGTIVEVTRGN